MVKDFNVLVGSERELFIINILLLVFLFYLSIDINLDLYIVIKHIIKYGLVSEMTFMKVTHKFTS